MHQASFVTNRALLVLKNDDIMDLKGQGKLVKRYHHLEFGLQLLSWTGMPLVSYFFFFFFKGFLFIYYM